MRVSRAPEVDLVAGRRQRGVVVGEAADRIARRGAGGRGGFEPRTRGDGAHQPMAVLFRVVGHLEGERAASPAARAPDARIAPR